AESMRAAEFLRKILQLIKRRETEREEVSINTVIRDALRLTQFDRDEYQAEIVMNLAENLPLVFADPIQITQVILNLVLNGLQAMAENQDRPRRMTIRTEMTDDGDVLVSIADSGHGVPLENQSRIFEQFYTTKQQGLGMGLSISRSIVEAHSGRIRCESVPGGGTVFRFSLNSRQPLPADLVENNAPTSKEIPCL
ncbi:MAG: sensor histidine kinase, partial [Planctomycetaceae bacterium]